MHFLLISYANILYFYLMHSYLKNSVALLFLTIFLALRVGNAHTILHWNEDIDTPQCELCDVITQSQELTPLLDSVSYESESDAIFCLLDDKAITNYKAPLYWSVFPTDFLNKPPPAY